MKNNRKKYKKFELDKGAKLYYVKNNINKSTMVRILFESGARCDTIPGLAHFTEHMFFTGTDTQSEREISKEYFDFLGVNASTNTTDVAFHGTIFPSKLKDYFAMVAKLITKSTFSPEAVEKEKPVVQQEIVSYNDKYTNKIYYFNEYNLTKAEELKYEIIGTKKSVESITSDDVKSFVKNYFVANNIKVFICTTLSARKVKRYLKDTLINDLTVNENLPDLPSYYLKIVDDKFYKVKTIDIDKNYIFINFKLNHDYLDFDFYYKLRVVNNMINDYTTGIMTDLRLKKSLVYGAVFRVEDYEDSGVISFTTECQKENINEVIKTAFDYLKRINKNGFTQAELDKVKTQEKFWKLQKVATPGSKLSRLYQYRDYGKILPSGMADKVLEKITLDECNAIFREVFTTANVSLGVYGNAKKDDVMPKDEFRKLLLSQT